MNDRLLTGEERMAVNKEYIKKHPDHLEPRAEFSYLNKMLEAQDAKTRGLTLKEVGEWLDNRLNAITFEHSSLKTIYVQKKDIEALKRGEMPG